MAKTTFTKRTEYGTVRNIVWHPKAKVTISSFPEDVRREIGYLLYLLQVGSGLTMPHSRPIKTVAQGVNELRVKGRDGIYRTFYFTKSDLGILVFHAFIKKTQATSGQDILIGKKRLHELLEDCSG
ncbi:hypothetical protein D3C87_1348770 [compost metagenome]